MGQGASENESLTNLSNELMKREIASFTIKGKKEPRPVSKIKLKILPLCQCSDSSALFENDNLFSNNKMIVSIKSDKNSSPKKIKEIRFVPHGKVNRFLIDSAFSGIYNPIFCPTEKINTCRVLQSKDWHRMYVYVLCGKDNYEYEVTWIIKDNKYYGRVVDEVEN